MLQSGDYKRRLAILGGLCFFLSAIEYMIPKPLPFLRLGLANLPLLAALDILPFTYFTLLLLLKITGQALITGTLFSYIFIFSLGGTLASGLLMFALRKVLGQERISLIGVSTLGAIVSNVTQLLLARVFIFGESIRFAAAPVLALGLFTGIILGAFCEYFVSRSKWYNEFCSPSQKPVPLAEHPGEKTITEPLVALTTMPKAKLGTFRKKREDFFLKLFNSNYLAMAGLLMIPALLFNPETNSRIIQCGFFIFLAWLSGKKINPLLSFFYVIIIIFFNLLIPYGELLFTIGPLRITSGALEGGIRRAVTLTGLFMLSRFCVRRELILPGLLGKIMGEALSIFSLMGEKKVSIKNRDWVSELDKILLELEMGNEKAEENFGKYKSPGQNAFLDRAPYRPHTQVFFLILLLSLAWLPMLLMA